MSDNLLVLMIVLISLSTCGKPDLWDAGVVYLTKNPCEQGK